MKTAIAIDKAAWHPSMLPGQIVRVAAPLVEDCRAHLECETLDTRAFGQEALVFGTIVSASIDSACTQGTSAEQYAQLQPMFFLENRLYAPLGAVSSIG